MKKLILLLFLATTVFFGATETSVYGQSVNSGLETYTVSGTDTYTFTASLPASLTTNERYILKFTNGNTGPATLKRGSLAAKALVKISNTALSAGDISDGQRILVQYDGTRYVIVGSVGSGSSGLPALGTAYNQLRINSGGAALEYFDPMELINSQSTDYTLVLADGYPKAKQLVLTGSTNRTFTIPTNASVNNPVNTKIPYVVLGTGDLTISGAGGVAVTHQSGSATVTDQYATGILWQQATDVWVNLNGSSVTLAGLGGVPTSRTVAGADLTANISAATLQSALGIPIRSYVGTAADVTTTATTYADVTGYSLAVTSGTKYIVTFVVPYTASATTEGAGFSVTGPASPTFINIESRWPSTSINETYDFSRVTYDSASPSTASVVPGSTGDNFVRVTVRFQPSSSGTLQLRFRAETGGANSVTVHCNGWGYVEYVIVP